MEQVDVTPFGVDLMRTLSADEVEFARGPATASASPTSNGGTVMDRDD